MPLTSGMLDWLIWPWFERLPVFQAYNLQEPDFPGLKKYQEAMWNTGTVLCDYCYEIIDNSIF